VSFLDGKSLVPQNGALFKKLGFLAEALELDEVLVDECARNLTTGYAHLDKRSRSEENKLITKWRLWVPKDVLL